MDDTGSFRGERLKSMRCSMRSLSCLTVERAISANALCETVYTKNKHANIHA